MNSFIDHSFQGFICDKVTEHVLANEIIDSINQLS